MTIDWADSMATELMTLVAFGGQTTETRRAIAARLRKISDESARDAVLGQRFQQNRDIIFGTQ